MVNSEPQPVKSIATLDNFFKVFLSFQKMLQIEITAFFYHQKSDIFRWMTNRRPKQRA